VRDNTVVTELCRAVLTDGQTPFNGLTAKSTWVSSTRKVKPIWILMKKEMMGRQWHQLDHMQVISTLLQTDNHDNTSSLSFFTDRMLFPTSKQQCQSVEGTNSVTALLQTITDAAAGVKAAMPFQSYVRWWLID